MRRLLGQTLAQNVEEVPYSYVSSTFGAFNLLTGTIEQYYSNGLVNLTLSDGTVVTGATFLNNFIPTGGSSVVVARLKDGTYSILGPNTSVRAGAAYAKVPMSATVRSYDDGRYGDPAAAVNTNGIVSLRGRVGFSTTSITAGTTYVIASLPSKFCPARSFSRAALFQDSSGNLRAARIDVNPGGVILFVVQQSVDTTNSWINLNGLTFPAKDYFSANNFSYTSLGANQNGRPGQDALYVWLNDPSGHMWLTGLIQGFPTSYADNAKEYNILSPAMNTIWNQMIPGYENNNGGSTVYNNSGLAGLYGTSANPANYLGSKIANGSGYNDSSQYYGPTWGVGSAHYWPTVGTGMDPYTAFTYQNSWGSYGDVWERGGYWKDPGGMVHLRGLVAYGTTGAVIATLPVGYRPGKYMPFYTMSNNNFARVDVNPDGTINASTGVSNVWVTLNDICFYPEG